MKLQHTIKHPIKCSGVGIHSGSLIDMEICPASEDTGIVFKRHDVSEHNIIPALYNNVIDTSLCTKIGNKHGVHVATIEHLMASFWGTGIDNAVVLINGPEVPTMDGSSDFFVQNIQKTGTIKQSKQKKYIKIDRIITVSHNNASITIEPYDHLSINFQIAFDNQHIKQQQYIFDEKNDFVSEISKARTFGFVRDLKYLQENGLAQGASLENVIAIDDGGILNKDGLRYKNEFVRHKILDCIGDLYLSGFNLHGKITAIKSGHQLNNMLLQEIFAVALQSAA